MNEPEDPASYWDHRAKTYDGIGWVHNTDLLDWTLQRVAPHDVKRLSLEIGCGTGAFTARLVGRTSFLDAIDVSAEMVERARARVELSHFVKFDVGSDEALVADGTLKPSDYSLVASRMVLHHTTDPREAVARWLTLCAPGGTLAIAEGPPVVSDRTSRAWKLYQEALEWKEPGRHFFTAADIAQWALDAGAVEVSVHERYSDGNSLRNWLDGSRIDGELRELIVDLHDTMFREDASVARAYRAEQTADGDWLMRWRHCVVVARKGS